MITLTLAMIVKNEEVTLERCLESAKDAFDEIIIVDTGSTDKTKSIARKYTNHVPDFEWIDDFAAARNFAFSKATMQYTMWLDADDIIDPKNLAELIALKHTLDPAIDTIMMRYITGTDEYGNITFSYYRERIIKTSEQFQWVDPVHEYMIAAGNRLQVEIAVTHLPPALEGERAANKKSRNLMIYESMLEKNMVFSPRNILYYARELSDNNFHEKAAKKFEEFLNTREGWVEDNINACLNLSRCYKIIGHSDKILPTLFRSFEYDLPRGELICEIARYYQSSNEINKAIFYYELALTLPMPDTWGFIQKDYWDFIPLIELSVCYDIAGDIKKALDYHDQAKHLKPEHSSIQYNDQYFATKKQG